MEALFFALEQWKSLTGEETQAISQSNWESLAKIHNHKSILQSSIDEHLGKLAGAKNSSNHLILQNSKGAIIEGLVDQLIVMEKENASELQNRITSIKDLREKLKQSGANLKRIRNAYSGELIPRWQQLS